MLPLRILLIEDQAITARDIKETLEKAGHQVRTIVANYQDTLAIFKAEMPDLTIVDIHLEGSPEDGIKIAQKLLQHKCVPIIYLTAYADLPLFQRAKETRPAAYLLKPFQHRELVFQIELAYLNQLEKVPATTLLHESESLFIPHNKGHERIEKQNILYLHAHGSYVKLFVVNQPQPYLLTMHLGHLVQYFSPTQFFRLSRSLFVNLSRIARLENNNLYLTGHPNPILIPDASRADLLNRLAVVRFPTKNKSA